MALSNPNPALEQTDAPEQADFFLFPEYLDGLLDNVGLDGTRHFLATLPFFGDYADRHIFYSNHDNNTPFNLPSIFFQVSINRFKRDPGAIAIPYPAQWMQDITPDFNFSRLRYLTSFTGNIASAPVRGELVLSTQREQRLSVYVDPVATFHCHTKSREEQAQRRKNYLESIADSLTVLCPRGEGTNSIRFYETLAAGRIPILVSDCCLLPYEDQIEYSSCCLKIAEQDIPRAGRILADWIVATGRERLFDMCKQAKIIHDRYFTLQSTVEQTIATLATIKTQHYRPITVTSAQLHGKADTQKGLAQAAAYLDAGDTRQAEQLLLQTLQKDPTTSTVWLQLGLVLQTQSRLNEALECFRRAESLSPDDPGPPGYAASIYQALGRFDEAERFNIRAQILTSDSRQAAQSEAANKQALTAGSATVERLLSLATQFREQEDWNAALKKCGEILALQPDNQQALLGLGGALYFLNRHQESAAVYRQAIKLAPDNVAAHVNLAMSLLACGQFKEGWRELEWRIQRIQHLLPPIPLLTANDVQQGRLKQATILLHSEQGYGDTLQFIRYANLLADGGATSIVTAQPEISELLTSCPGVSKVIPHGDLLPTTDFQALLQSLPAAFSTTAESIPRSVPYLFPDETCIRTYRQAMSHQPGLKIGLCWQGRQLGKSGYHRSLQLEELAPLFAVPGTSFYSLQVDNPAELPDSISRPAPALQTFSDTAALICSLDLVITIDTSVAHLAGALGKPTWVLLLWSADWRWLTNSEDTPWYPTMRLFRQDIPSSWEHAISRVVQELKVLNNPQPSLITMSQLGRYGFGNQIFQYAFLKIYAKQHQLKTETPVWIGTYLFGHQDSPITKQLPNRCVDPNTHNQTDIPDFGNTLYDTDIEGFFQFHTSFYLPHKTYFRSLYRPLPAIAKRLAPAAERLRNMGKTVIGVHIRRGDYAYVNHRFLFMAPTAWYMTWLQEIWGTLDNPVVFIASDEPENILPDFADFNPVSYLDLDPTLTPDVFCADYYIDFYLLSICNMVAISNSTFSFAACMLNETGTTFMRPHLPTQRLIPFEPWDSEVLLRDEP